ncbi:MAG: hypothetical protein JXA94_01870, partial [Parachlamydiales bacterium]|nr:hypothetical protein [Parachlamydiales bacterium]
MKKAAVFCSHGLGDGLIFLIISYNLYRNGYAVDTYHPSLFELQRWFDYTNLKKEPNEDQIEEVLSQYDLIIINSDFRKINKEIKKKAFEKFKSKTFDLHPTTCKGRGKPIGCKRFDFQKTINENLIEFCEKILKLKNVIKDNGIKIPKDLTHRKFLNRVIIHPTSNDPQKNWP